MVRVTYHVGQAGTLTYHLKSKIIDDDPMSWLGFEEDCIITACALGHIRLWSRPQEATGTSQVDLGT